MSLQVQIVDVEVGQGTMSVTVNAMPDSVPFDPQQAMYLSVQAYPDGGNAYGFGDHEALMEPGEVTEVTVEFDLNRQPEGEFIVQAVLSNTITGDDAIAEQVYTADGSGGDGDGPSLPEGNELLQQVVLGAGVAVAATYGYKKFAGN